MNIKKLWLLAIVSIVVSQASAQKKFARGIDADPIHFGFQLGVNNTSMRIVKQPNFRDSSLMNLSTASQPGFNLGIVSNLRMGKYFDLRLVPALTFTEHQLKYEYANAANNITKRIESTYIEVPLSVKFKSTRINNHRFYLIGGLQYNYNLSAGKEKQNEDEFDLTTIRVKEAQNGISYSFGFGFDIYNDYFKFTPEIKITNGLQNVLVTEKHQYSSVIDKLFLRTFVLSFYFE